jgi:hypothetical protein
MRLDAPARSNAPARRRLFPNRWEAGRCRAPKAARALLPRRSAATPPKAAFENLEDEMANLLGVRSLPREAAKTTA